MGGNVAGDRIGDQPGEALAAGGKATNRCGRDVRCLRVHKENSGPGGVAGIRVRGATHDLVFENNVIRDTRTGGSETQSVGVLIEEEAGEITLSGNDIQAQSEIEDRREKR